MTTRDIKADMKAALIHEYEGYVRAGRKADAEQVAKVLKEQYGHDVAKQDDGGKKAVPERADVEKPPEAAVEPKPARKTAAKRTASKSQSEDK